MTERKKFIYILLVFFGAYFMPVDWPRFQTGMFEAFALVRWYAREHVLLCLVPAFFIAGAISVFVSQASVLKYFGASANKVVAYGVASVSGSILAVCSCTVLPLFSGIYTRGAGLGPALALLLVGPALSLPSMLVINQMIGPRKTVSYCALVVIMATPSGILYGHLF